MDDDLGFAHRFVAARSTGQPTLLLLHGMGGGENDLLPLGSALLADANLLSPRGKVLENGMPRFFRRFAQGVLDVEDLKQRTHELADFVAAASAHYGFDGASVVAVGYSNGANIAASALLLRPDTLAGAILLRPMVPFVPETPPDLAKKPVFIGGGRRDELVPPEEVARLAALLRSAGADVTLDWQERGGHGLTLGDAQAAEVWLRRLF